MPPRRGRPWDVWAQVGFYSSLGFILPAGAVAGYIVGWALDGWLHTKPILAVIFGFLGAAGGLIEVFRLLTREERRGGGSNSNAGSAGGGDIQS